MIEVLLATMHRKNFDIVNQMNVKSDITVINQTNSDSKEIFELNGISIQWINSTERGLSNSRNNAMNNARCDICLLADDDMIYRDDYQNIVTKAFEENPKADIIIFGIQNIERKEPVGLKIKKNKKLNYRETMQACSVQIGLKVNTIKKHNLQYNIQFGPGGRYNMGDENIFLTRCYKKGLRIYSYPHVIADIETCNSSWFEGFTEKYLFDRGAILGGMSKQLSALYIIRFALINYRCFIGNYTIFNAIKIMLCGRSDYIKHIENDY